MKNTITQETSFEFPIAKVWAAITDPVQISAWFGATFAASFTAGQPASAVVTYQGYEGLTFEIDIVTVNASEIFSFAWHPYTIDLERDYSEEPKTLVEFRLRATDDGTVVVVTESGFDKIYEDRAEEAYEGNLAGWVSQMEKLNQFLHKGRVD